MLGTALTAVIGIVARGKAAKAIAGTVSGAIATQLANDNSLVSAFVNGVTTGALPKVTELGVMVGEVAIGGLIGWILTWFAPKNKAA